MTAFRSPRSSRERVRVRRCIALEAERCGSPHPIPLREFDLSPQAGRGKQRCAGITSALRLPAPTHGEANLTEIADSYVCGTADAPLLGDTIGHSLDLAARRWGNREALVSPSHGVRWTWKELTERVDALAAGFLALGLERGARIGVWSLNRPEWTLTQFAAAKAGLILVTINPAYRLSELEFALAKVGCAGDRHRHRVQDLQLHGDAEHAAAGACELATRRAERGAAAAAARGDPGRRPEGSRHDCVRGRERRWAARATATRWRHWPRPCSSTMPSTSSSPAAPPARPRASR